LGCAATKRRLTLSANNHEKNLNFAPVGRVAPEILRQPALETGPAKLYERLAMRVCCVADRAGRSAVRYPAETIEAMRQHLLGYRDNMRVEVETDIAVTAKTVADLRALATWPDGLALNIHVDLDPRLSVVRVERAS
jgi:hypothetical protein